MRNMRERPGPAPVDPPELSGWATMKRMAPYLWPKGQSWVKRRVVLSLCALVLAKIISVSTPFFYKAAVDALAGEAPSPSMMLGLGAVSQDDGTQERLQGRTVTGHPPTR